MKVQMVYRNYKPLHKIYESLVLNPPKDIEYIIPPVRSGLGRFKVIYRKFKHLKLVKFLLSRTNDIIFSKSYAIDVDLYHAINIVPPLSRGIRLPYVLEAEHAAALTNFTDDRKLRAAATSFIKSDNCRAVICTSKASQTTFKWLLGKDYKTIEKKFSVVYPTLPVAKDLVRSNEIMKGSNKIKLLFVGNDSYRKGLNELLIALRALEQSESYRERIELYVVSSDAEEIVLKYSLDNVKCFSPTYSKEEILQKFFMPADVFVMPTKLDTFGMVVVDALNSGTPVMSTRQFALPELITHGQNGWLLDLKDPLLDRSLYRTKADRENLNSDNVDMYLANSIEDNIKHIIDQRSDIEAMGRNAKEMFKTGMLSIEKRNEAVKAIYIKSVQGTGRVLDA